MIIIPYKKWSVSAKALAKLLKCPRGSAKTLRNYAGVLAINWGNSSKLVHRAETRLLNNPAAVKTAINKLTALSCLKDAAVSVVPYTTDKEQAKTWLNDGMVVARTLLKSSGGKGIKLLATGDKLPDAPLYTKYKKKFAEFRVHVLDGEVIDVTEKRKKRGGVLNKYLRNYRDGWVFCRTNIKEPEQLRQTCIEAVKALGLDFGAVDIIWNKHEDSLYVLEVNTAPGLTGTTLQKYVQAIKALGA